MGGGIHLATMLKEHLENFAQLAVRGADMHRDRGGCKAFPPTPGDSQAQASAVSVDVREGPFCKWMFRSQTGCPGRPEFTSFLGVLPLQVAEATPLRWDWWDVGRKVKPQL